MAERKVLNKYYPSDFDPDKLRTIEKKNTPKICNVRMMLPMTMKCYTCGTYTYIGTKCNMKVEPVQDEDYLGITLYRFYYRCSNCFSQITFKTDPKNNDYTAEIGASRNHEPWKDIMLAEEEYKNNKKMEMRDDAMKNLEYRTYDSKREMDILEATDKVKELNRREANIDFDELIKKIRESHDKKDKLNINNEKENEKEKEKQALNEKKEIEKIFRNIKNMKNSQNNEKNNQDDNKNILDKLIKGIDYKMKKNGRNKEKMKEEKEKKLKEKIENNFFLKKKVEREEKDLENNKNNKFSKFLDNSEEENSNNSEEEKNIKDIFKKPLINFSKFKEKK